eukprot:988552-Karenia_brevis.AAC.1
MRDFEATPRTLADDLLITVNHADRPLLRFQLAFEKTCEFLGDMGAQISANKSRLFTNHPPFKAWLVQRTWRVIDTTVPLVNNFRDLGSDAAITKALSTTVSRDRLTKATGTARKIARLPHELPKKAVFLRASAIAQGLYSCEASSVDEVMLTRFTHQLVELIQPNGYQPAAGLVFLLADVGDDLDPSIIILLRRLMMHRRMIHKHPELFPLVQDILDYYASIQHKGLYKDEQHLAQLQP